jgi:hypothetical protein
MQTMIIDSTCLNTNSDVKNLQCTDVASQMTYPTLCAISNK